MGAMPVITMRTLSARAAALPVSRSMIIARPMTMPADAPMPWKRRATTSTVAVGAIAEMMLAAT